MKAISVAKELPSAMILTAGAALILCLCAFAHPIGELVHQWGTEEYSHGPIIPFIAALLAWHRLTEIRPLPRPSWFGVILIAAAAVLLLIGELSTFYQVALYGLLLCLIGLCLAFLGSAVLRVTLPAFIYLFFCIPLPQLLFNSLSSQLQLVSSTLGVAVLDAMNFPVFQEGNVIDLGVYKLQVVEACSGLRYLFPLISFSYLAAYLLDGSFVKRAIIILSAIPITIGMNSLRIALIGATVNLWGIRMAEGLIHDFEGWSIFLLCAAVLMVEVWLLNRVGRQGVFRYHYLGMAHGQLFGARPTTGGPGYTALAISGLMVLGLATGILSRGSEVLPPHRDLADFPLSFGTWRGHREDLQTNVLKELQLTDYWIADYADAAATSPVNLYIAYYQAQKIGSAAHSPSSCIPGGGWKIVDTSVRTIALNGAAAGDAAQPVTLSRILIQKGGAYQLVYYWFDERGRDLTNQFAAKWYLTRDSLVFHRTDGALIRLVTAVQKDEPPEQADQRLEAFLGLVLPTVKSYLPTPPNGE